MEQDRPNEKIRDPPEQTLPKPDLKFDLARPNPNRTHFIFYFRKDYTNIITYFYFKIKSLTKNYFEFNDRLSLRIGFSKKNVKV